MGSQTGGSKGAKKMRIFFLVIFLFSCSSSQQKELQFNLGTEVIQLDWNDAIDTSSMILLDNIMEGLTSYTDSIHSSELVRPLPALAESWSISEGGKRYLFKLRKGVVWTDGVPLEAMHFVNSWKRLLSPNRSSPNAYLLSDIVGAIEYHRGGLKDFSQVGIRAVDKGSLEVRLKKPVPYFLHLMASSSTFPFRSDLEKSLGSAWLFPNNVITLGAYRIEDWKQGENFKLVANDRYWGKAPLIPNVVLRMVEEPLTAFSLYQAGLLDILPRDLPTSYLHQLQSRPDYRTAPKMHVSYLLFRQSHPAFRTADLRRNFIEGLDRKSLAYYFKGAQTKFSAWVPPGLLGYEPELGVQARDQQFDTQYFPPISLHYSGSDTWNLVFQRMKTDLEKSRGLRLNLAPMSQKKYRGLLLDLSMKKSPMPDLLLVGWVADYPDANNFMKVFTSFSETNYVNWKNEDYDSLVATASSSSEENVRTEAYLEAQKILLEKDVVIMPLFLASHQALVRETLEGVNLNVLDKWYFRNISYGKEGWGAKGKSLIRRLGLSRAGT